MSFLCCLYTEQNEDMTFLRKPFSLRDQIMEFICLSFFRTDGGDPPDEAPKEVYYNPITHDQE